MERLRTPTPRGAAPPPCFDGVLVDVWIVDGVRGTSAVIAAADPARLDRVTPPSTVRFPR